MGRGVSFEGHGKGSRGNVWSSKDEGSGAEGVVQHGNDRARGGGRDAQGERGAAECNRASHQHAEKQPLRAVAK